MKVNPKIKYQSEVDPTFAEWLTGMPGGERLHHCIQCGTCSGACPLSGYMDYSPRKIINMARAGFKDEVLHSNTIWLCASCYSCTSQCPMNLKVTEIMYLLRQRAIREKTYPKRFPSTVLSREFFHMIERFGRSTETVVLINLILKTNPLKFIGLAPLGLHLFRTGRIGFHIESIKAKKELRTILKAVEE
jgi:quinone-modifying oxidoreductase subunit QmoC